MSRWPTGTERETSPGIYATHLGAIEGWNLWLFENAQGTSKFLVKAAEGCPCPVPLGVGQTLYSGGIYMSVHVSSVALAVVRSKQHYVSKAEMRVDGERFARELRSSFDPLPYDGQRLEVFMSTMPGPRSFAKILREHGVIDMTGFGAALGAARTYHPSVDASSRGQAIKLPVLPKPVAAEASGVVSNRKAQRPEMIAIVSALQEMLDAQVRLVSAFQEGGDLDVNDAVQALTVPLRRLRDALHALGGPIP